MKRIEEWRKIIGKNHAYAENIFEEVYAISIFQTLWHELVSKIPSLLEIWSEFFLGWYKFENIFSSQ